jgi:hypothetical protein
VREHLGWMEESFEVRFEGLIDIGSSNDPQMKTMSPVCNEEWTTYVGVVMKSEIRGIEFVARRVGKNIVYDESSRLSTLPEAVDEQAIECVVVLTQLLQASHDEGDADDSPLMEIMK